MPKLQDLLEHQNIAEALSKEQLARIARDVIETYKADKRSREKWEVKSQESINYVKQILKERTHPWPECSNVCMPILTVASQSFAARIYPEMFKDSDIVKVSVFGDDPDGRKFDRAQRVSAHMSYQRLEESETWESDTDKLLHILPIIGTCFKKVYYDEVRKTTQADLCDPQDIIINHNEASIEKAERITHRFRLNKRDVTQKIRAGVYLDFDVDDVSPIEDRWKTSEDDESDYDPKTNTKVEFLEQHCYLDLDGDGYEEPWIVVVAKASEETVAIYPRFEEDKVQYSTDGEIANIDPIIHFIDYHFIPSPDGGFYSLGYGHVLYTLLETINTLTNQLVDAGTLANTSCGLYSKALKIKGGQLKIKQGDFKEVDTGLSGAKISDQVYQLNFNPPNPVTLQLLGMLLDSAQKITSISDILSGDTKPQNAPAGSVIEILKQGMQVYNAIYKRFYRSCKKEFKLIFKFNSIYLTEQQYFLFGDSQMYVAKADYKEGDLDISPTANPSSGADAQKSIQSQALIQIMQNPVVAQNLKIPAVIELIAEGLKFNKEDIAKLFLSDQEKAQMAQNQPPNPDMMKAQLAQQKLQADQAKAQQAAQIQQQKTDLAQQALQVKAADSQHRNAIKESETHAKQAKMIADAHFKEVQAHNMGASLNIQQQQVELLKKKVEQGDN